MTLPDDNIVLDVVHSSCEEDLDIDAFFLPGGILDPDATRPLAAADGSSVGVETLVAEEDPLSGAVNVLTDHHPHYSATTAPTVVTTLTTACTEDLTCLLPPRSPANNRRNHHHHHSSPLPMNPWEAVTTPLSPSATTITSLPLGGLPDVPNIVVPSENGEEDIALLLGAHNCNHDKSSPVQLPANNDIQTSSTNTTPARVANTTITTTEDLSSWLLLPHGPPSTHQTTSIAAASADLLVAPHPRSIPNISISSSCSSRSLSSETARARLGLEASAKFLPVAPDITKTTRPQQYDEGVHGHDHDSPWWSGVAPSPVQPPVLAAPPGGHFSMGPLQPHSPPSLRWSRPFPPPPGFETDPTVVVDSAVSTTTIRTADTVGSSGATADFVVPPRRSSATRDDEALPTIDRLKPASLARVVVTAAQQQPSQQPHGLDSFPHPSMNTTPTSGAVQSEDPTPPRNATPLSAPPPPLVQPLCTTATPTMSRRSSSSNSNKLHKRKKKQSRSSVVPVRDQSPEGPSPPPVDGDVTHAMDGASEPRPIESHVTTTTTMHGNGHAAVLEPLTVREEAEPRALGQSVVQNWNTIRSILEPWTRTTVGAVVLVVKYIAIFFMALGTVGEYALEEGALGMTKLWHELLSTLRIHPHHYYYEPRQTSEYVLCSMVLYLFPFLCDVLMNYTDCPHYTPHILSNAALYALSLRLSRLSLADYTSTIPAKRGKPSSSNSTNNYFGSSSCTAEGPSTNTTTNHCCLSETDRRQLEYELGHRILRSLRYAIPCNFVLEGFSAANASFALADPPRRLILAYSMSLVRHGLLLSPVAWMGWSTQILLATHLPARGMQLDFILILVGLAFLRLVGTLHGEPPARGRIT